MASEPTVINFPNSIDDNITLLRSENNSLTTLNGSVNQTTTTINVNSTNTFPNNSGVFTIDDEIIIYRGKTSTSFTNCIRGSLGSVAASHNTNTKAYGKILSIHHNVLIDAIVAIQDYVLNPYEVITLNDSESQNIILENKNLIVFVDTTENITLTLPDATDVNGKTVFIKKLNGTNVTITITTENEEEVFDSYLSEVEINNTEKNKEFKAVSGLWIITK